MSGGIEHDTNYWDWLPEELHLQILHAVSKSCRETLPYLEELKLTTETIRLQLTTQETWANDFIQNTNCYVFISAAKITRFTCAFVILQDNKSRPWYIQTPFEYSLYWLDDFDSHARQISNCYWNLFREKWKHQSIKYMHKGINTLGNIHPCVEFLQ